MFHCYSDSWPYHTVSSELLRSMALALASISISMIPLKIGLMTVAILSTILLWCTSLIAIILKLTLTVLRSLASIVASTLTLGIVTVIARVFICISFICLLGFWWVLSLFLRFSFRFSSTSGLFWFCAFKWLRYFTLLFVH